MRKKWSRYVMPAILVATMWGIPVAANAADEHHGGHKEISGVVVQKAGRLEVKTPEGATYQLSPKAAERHGHDSFKEGEEVTVMVDENNLVMEIHRKGQEGAHRFVTGKLVYGNKDKMAPEIKLQTAEGLKVFPLGKQEVKTEGIPEGTAVTVELNEAGTVIDLHRADKGHGH